MSPSLYSGLPVCTSMHFTMPLPQLSPPTSCHEPKKRLPDTRHKLVSFHLHILSCLLYKLRPFRCQAVILLILCWMLGGGPLQAVRWNKLQEL